MLALAGYPLGMRFRFFDAVDGPAGQVGELTRGNFEDTAALDRFADGCDVVTYEFENVPVAAARHLAKRIPVFPPPNALETAQDRLAEKTLFTRLGIPTPGFAAVDSREQLAAAMGSLGLPAVLKTRRMGYDGKGQTVLRAASELDAAWKQLGSVPLILESFVPFDRELSSVAVRSRDGHAAFYPLAQNEHREGILRVSIAPAPGIDAQTQATAESHSRAVLEALNYVGVLAIEWFQVGDQLLANEMAPRVHNSGHWTQDGAVTSQFENHLRAILGLPLGDPAPRGHAAMINLIGTIPAPADVLSHPGTHLHLYGKDPRPGRKLGHINLCEPNPSALEYRLSALRAVIGL
jgi:5-(carboxyamino)imidazole ribonucleotide synthase